MNKFRSFSFVVGSFVLLLAAAASATAAYKARVSRETLLAMEKSFDNRVKQLWEDNTQFVLLGPTRGIYLEGYGAVFTAEVNLVTGPTMMMRTSLTQQELTKHRQKKLERVPQLRFALRQALADAAASLDTVPAEEQIVLAVYLYRYGWELDTTGIPAMITVQAQKKKLLEAKRTGVGFDAAIQVTEN